MAEESFDPTLADDLKDVEFTGAWEAGKSRQREDQPVGMFQCELTTATIGRSQASDRLQIAYELTIITGEHKDKVLRKYDGLETDQQCQMAQSSLAALGVDAKKIGLDKLPATLLSLKGMKVTVQTKQNGDFYNVYFRRQIKQPKKTSTPKKILTYLSSRR